MEKTSALVRFVDCNKLEQELQAELEARKKEIENNPTPLPDPCWQWVEPYLQNHRDEMTPWAVSYLEEIINRIAELQYFGRTYEEAQQLIQERVDECRQGKGESSIQEGMQIVVRSGLRNGRLTNSSTSIKSPSKIKTQLRVGFSRYPGGGTAQECPAVPEAVFMKDAYVTNPVYEEYSGSIHEIRYLYENKPVRLEISYNIKAKIRIIPTWLPVPNGVNVNIGGWTAKFDENFGYLDFIISISNLVFSPLLQRHSDINQSGEIVSSPTFYFVYFYEKIPIGVHTVWLYGSFRHSGGFRIKSGQHQIIFGQYQRNFVQFSGMWRGEVQINLGEIVVADLALVNYEFGGTLKSRKDFGPFIIEDHEVYNDTPGKNIIRLKNSNNVEVYIFELHVGGIHLEAYQSIKYEDFPEALKNHISFQEQGIVNGYVIELITFKQYFSEDLLNSPKNHLYYPGKEKSIHIKKYRRLAPCASVPLIIDNVVGDAVVSWSQDYSDPTTTFLTIYHRDGSRDVTIYYRLVNNSDLPIYLESGYLEPGQFISGYINTSLHDGFLWIFFRTKYYSVDCQRDNSEIIKVIRVSVFRVQDT